MLILSIRSSLLEVNVAVVILVSARVVDAISFKRLSQSAHQQLMLISR